MDDAVWSEYRGPNDDQQPRPLSPASLALLLKPFQIRPHSIWPLQRKQSKSRGTKGYLRIQFEAAWRKYCPEGGTTAQSRKIKLVPSN